jgi:capsular exopolysaccharide synthesis family protein
VELQQILDILRRRKWIALQAFLVVAVTAMGVTFLLTPTYTSSGKIYIKQLPEVSSQRKIPALTEVTSLLTQSSDADLSMALALSRPLMDRMASTLQLRNDVGDLRRGDELILSNLLYPLFPKPLIEITRAPETNLLQIWAYSTDPQEAAMMANTLADLLVEESRADTRAEYRAALAFVDQQIDGVKAEYDTALDELRRFQEERQTVNLGAEKELAADEFVDLLKQKETDLVRLAEARAKLQTIRGQTRMPSGEDVATLVLDENPQVRALKERLSTLEIELAAALAEFTEAAPQVKVLREQIARIRSELPKELQVQLATGVEAAALEREIAGITAHSAAVDATIDRLVASSFRGLPAKSAEQARLELALNASERVYGSLLEYRSQIGVAEASVLSNIRVVNPAVVPPWPSSPRKLLNLAISMCLGTLVGVGLALLQESLDDSVQKPRDLEVGSTKGLPVLATIPRFRGADAASITSLPPTAEACEAYRGLRHALEFASPDRPLKRLLFTSAWAGEGKTTTVANLGVTLARDRRRVLLVDADLRQPGLDLFFDGQPAPLGLSDLLAGVAQLEEVIRQTDIEGLHLLPAGRPPLDPAQLIESSRFHEMIETLSTRFDVVLIDSPPALLVHDALVLGAHVDGVITLFESGGVSREDALALYERLQRARVRVIGAVFTKFDAGRTSSAAHRYYRSLRPPS